MMSKLYASILVLGLAGILSACDNQGSTESAVETISQTVEQVQESVEQVAEEAPENLDAVATETAEKMEETK